MEVWIRLRRQEGDEDDPELMQLTEEGCVRDLASGYWARPRISDAYWFNPADIWYQCSVPGPAIHPFPWTHHRIPPATVLCRPLTKSKKRRNIPKDLPSPPKFRHPNCSANKPTSPTSGKWV